MNEASATPDAVAPQAGSNTQTVTITDTKLAIFRETFGFVKGQHPAYLTLWAVLISLGACMWLGGRYVVNTAIPAHLASIKQGYKELWDKHLEDKQVTETAHREHITRAVDEMRRSNELMDSLVRQFILREQRREQQQAVGAGNKIPPGDGG